MPVLSAASPVGPFPDGITADCEFVFGSMRETVPSRLLVTQIELCPQAMAVGPLPTVIACTADPVRGSTRTTWLFPRSLTQRAWLQNASSVAAIGSGLPARPASPSILVIVLSAV